MSALTSTATRQALEALGHRPMKRLGQNFLVDGNIVRKSLEMAAIAPGERVVEVGPGLGTLTRALLDGGAEVFAVECDPRLHAHLQATLVAEFTERFHLLHGDAVKAPQAGLEAEAQATGEPPERLAGKTVVAHDAANPDPVTAPLCDAGAPCSQSGNFKIVANLPYAISTPWMEKVLAGPLPSRMVLMLQKEAADRFLAKPGSGNRGAISVFLTAAYVEAGRHPVRRGCFYPAPDVDSVLLRLDRIEQPKPFDAESRDLIRKIFAQRRKTLRRILKDLGI